ncbi:MAG: serine/threonine-protein kinase, partial [Polyangiaceae bacterium]
MKRDENAPPSDGASEVADPVGAAGESVSAMEETQVLDADHTRRLQRDGASGALQARPDRSDDVDLAPTLATGDMVEHFEVKELLGVGGMGEVYLARDTKLGRKVALKLIGTKVLGDDTDAIGQFLTEARLTARFSHPHIVQVYAVGEHRGLPYLALEYLRGNTLLDRIREGGSFSPREIGRMGLAIAEALAEAHRHGVLHRDLKPANVLVPPDGRLRVVDFGLARQSDDFVPMSELAAESIAASHRGDREVGSSSIVTSARGTPLYMAPEQWLETPLDAAVDVWALGVILYLLAAGRHPYANLDLHELAFAVTVEKSPPLLSDDADVPRPLAELIMQCMTKEPAARPSALEVIEKLRVFLGAGVDLLEDGENPFRGLLPFTEKQAGAFFGRDEEIARCVEHLRH